MCSLRSQSRHSSVTRDSPAEPCLPRWPSRRASAELHRTFSILRKRCALRKLYHSITFDPLPPSQVNLHKDIAHPNFVRYVDSFFHDNFVWIIMEYCDGGSLYDTLRRRPKQAVRMMPSCSYFYSQYIFVCACVCVCTVLSCNSRAYPGVYRPPGVGRPPVFARNESHSPRHQGSLLLLS